MTVGWIYVIDRQVAKKHRKTPKNSDSWKKIAVMILKFDYRNDPKFSDRYAWANSADPDQTAPRGAVWSGSTLFAIASTSFGCITLKISHLVQLLGGYSKFLGVWSFKDFYGSMDFAKRNASKKCWRTSKQCTPWSDCSCRSSLIGVYRSVCLETRDRYGRYGGYLMIIKRIIPYSSLYENVGIR